MDLLNVQSALEEAQADIEDALRIIDQTQANADDLEATNIALEEEVKNLQYTIKIMQDREQNWSINHSVQLTQIDQLKQELADAKTGSANVEAVNLLKQEVQQLKEACNYWHKKYSSTVDELDIANKNISSLKNDCEALKKKHHILYEEREKLLAQLGDQHCKWKYCGAGIWITGCGSASYHIETKCPYCKKEIAL